MFSIQGFQTCKSKLSDELQTPQPTRSEKPSKHQPPLSERPSKSTCEKRHPNGAVFVLNDRPKIERSLYKRSAYASNPAGIVGIPSLPVGCW